MRKSVHLANTDVEFEWASLEDESFSLEKSWARHPFCQQLQFLPLLYANPQDFVTVTALPDSDYLNTLSKNLGSSFQDLPRLISLEDADFSYEADCLSWGFSLAVKRWADIHHLYYEMPKDWQMIREVNSKAFSFKYTSLLEAALLFDEAQLRAWLENVQGTKLLKTCFGLSGQGHRKIEGKEPSEEVLKFCQREWQKKRPLIGEPWLTRLFDFSTQWLIHPHQQIEFLGATRFETDESGQYQGTLAGPELSLFSSQLPFLHRHCQFAKWPLQEMAEKGFFGHVGIDALVYQDEKTKEPSLYPIVEINARQTLSLVALRLQKRLYPDQIFHLGFIADSSLPSLLPAHIKGRNGKTIRFRKKLVGRLRQDLSF